MKGEPIAAVHKESGEIVLISRVTQTGLNCGCVCFDCDDRLEAVLNTVRRKHFRHYSNANCNPSPESRLHLMAKAIIKANSQICMPGRGMVAYTDPVCEVRCDDLVPDATIWVEGQPVYIEIVVTNPVHLAKIASYQAKRARVLVIRLEDEDRAMDEEMLTYLVLEDPDVRGWLNCDPEEIVDLGVGLVVVGAVVFACLALRRIIKAFK